MPLSLSLFSGSALVIRAFLEEGVDTAPQGLRCRRCEGVRGPFGRVRSFQGRSLRGWLLILLISRNRAHCCACSRYPPDDGMLQHADRIVCMFAMSIALVPQCFDESVDREPVSIFLMHISIVDIEQIGLRLVHRVRMVKHQFLSSKVCNGFPPRLVFLFNERCRKIWFWSTLSQDKAFL